MKILINIFSFIFSNLFAGDALAESPIPQDEAENVISGLDAVIKQNNIVVAFATGVTIDENFNLQGIKTLGYHGDRGFKSTDYNCRMTVDTFTVREGSDAALTTSTRRTILTDAPSEFELIDVTTGVTIKRVKGCRMDSKSERYEAGQLVTKNTTWFGREVVPVGVSE